MDQTTLISQKEAYRIMLKNYQDVLNIEQNVHDPWHQHKNWLPAFAGG